MTTPETPGSLEDRIVDLESHLAHQARVVEELNAVVTARRRRSTGSLRGWSPWPGKWKTSAKPSSGIR